MFIVPIGLSFNALFYNLLQTWMNVQPTMEVVNMSAVIPLVHMHVPAIMASCYMKMDMTVRKVVANMRLLHLLEPSPHPIILTTIQAGRTAYGISLPLQDTASSW
jgi:hypothetical protein